MNILIGALIFLFVVTVLGGGADNVERRQAEAVEHRHPLTNEPLDEYQRGECDSWAGWPENYRPWYCKR